MTEKDVRWYLDLMTRRSFILAHSGESWQPEYGPELERIDAELSELRQVIDEEHKRKEDNQVSKPLITAAEVAEIMDCSERYGYKIIQGLNEELKAKGFITRAGRVPRKYFYERVGLAEEVEA